MREGAIYGDKSYSTWFEVYRSMLMKLMTTPPPFRQFFVRLLVKMGFLPKKDKRKPPINGYRPDLYRPADQSVSYEPYYKEQPAKKPNPILLFIHWFANAQKNQNSASSGWIDGSPSSSRLPREHREIPAGPIGPKVAEPSGPKAYSPRLASATLKLPSKEEDTTQEREKGETAPLGPIPIQTILLQPRRRRGAYQAGENQGVLATVQVTSNGKTQG